ncbi:hypothetical protein [Candidatus Sodalis pierantonius]|uniref:hypothetical protein n=1 Tax=Candidatus Sodalis pierantonii TaxID=1486991 RepID=UPI0004B93AE8|nr:hypothetical protein [Candidatus Sodalis pierantonius]
MDEKQLQALANELCRFRRIRSAVPATSDQLFRYFPITHSSGACLEICVFA